MSLHTSEDATDTSLPSFSTFTSELDPTWDYYDRDRSGSDVITSQSNNYTRPWEMETKEKGFEPFSKLPSFQSQFHSYAESNMMPEPSLPQPVPVPVPMSPNSVSTASPGGSASLTQLTPINPLQTGLTPLSNPSFHTLTAVNTRPYGKLFALTIFAFARQIKPFSLYNLTIKNKIHFSVSTSSSSNSGARNSNNTTTVFGWTSYSVVSTDNDVYSTATTTTTKYGHYFEERAGSLWAEKWIASHVIPESNGWKWFRS